ncbi:MAG: FN3 associated domain-containing protein [Chryseolinea sp.]
MHPLVLHIPIGVGVFLVSLQLFAPKASAADRGTVVRMGLLLTSASASVAALFGFFLSLQGEYGGDALQQHKISGVILSWLCYFLVVLDSLEVKRVWFLSLGAGVIGVLVLAGHTGSILTHGENFLFGPMDKSSVVLTAENASVFQYAVAPIFEKKCYSCHNESKAKGKLVMTDIDRFKAGGEHGKPWVEGKPQQSRMIKAFYLPLDHDEHMPPDGKPQLTLIEIEVLKSWIKSGADFDKKLGEFPDGDTLKLRVAELVSKEPVQEIEKIYTFEAASDDDLEKMNTPFLSVSALYLNSPALQADFYVRKEFDIKSLQQLKAIANQLVVLSLSKMPVSDNDLTIIASFKNLEVLNLNFTSIQGEGLRSLEALAHLKSLSLSGTKVSARHLAPVLGLPELKQLYVWSTDITASQRDSLAGKHPDVSILLTQFDDNSMLRLSKPMLVNEGVIKPDDQIVFRHPMPGVTIRYTTDGSVPDSVNSLAYEHPFKFTKTTVVKAKGCKDGWFCSDMAEFTCFVRGKQPDELILLTQPDPQYPGEGVQSLTDGRKGVADVLKEPSWLGYRKNPFVVGVEFQPQPPEIKEIVISYARNIGGYSLPPKEVEVWGGESEISLKLIKKFTPQQPTENGALKVDMISVTIPPSTHKYYKLVVRQVPRLPEWHDGKGERSWVFIDELFFY